MDIVFNAREGRALRKNLMPFERSYQVESSMIDRLIRTETWQSLTGNEEGSNDHSEPRPRRHHQHSSRL